MGFGGMIAIIGMLFGIGIVSSGTAQRDKFGDIDCRSLRVVDADGKGAVVIGRDGVFVNGKGGKYGVSLQIDEHGGLVVVSGKDGESGAALQIDEHGGFVGALGKDGVSRATIAIS